ncbi:MAG: hypothetical protein KIS96_08990 [Bauldia sp.]|nr:hypothetical protein [Bauldia sp.]
MLRIHPALVGVAVVAAVALVVGAVLGPISCDTDSAFRWACQPDGTTNRSLYIVFGFVAVAAGGLAAYGWHALRRRAGIGGYALPPDIVSLPASADVAYARLKDVLSRRHYRIREEDAAQRALVAEAERGVYRFPRVAARIEPAGDGQSTLTIEGWPRDFNIPRPFRRLTLKLIDELRTALQA